MSSNLDHIKCPDCQRIYQKPLFRIDYHDTELLNLKQQIENLKETNKRLQTELENKYKPYLSNLKVMFYLSYLLNSEKLNKNFIKLQEDYDKLMVYFFFFN